jgi:MinD-like ATPase involved in chromosome partitioning or flagellar assembly
MVASSIVVINRLDGNQETQDTAERLIQDALDFLENSAKYWPNISNMVCTLVSLCCGCEAEPQQLIVR